jgi:hypothetical protein
MVVRAFISAQIQQQGSCSQSTTEHVTGNKRWRSENPYCDVDPLERCTRQRLEDVVDYSVNNMFQADSITTGMEFAEDVQELGVSSFATWLCFGVFFRFGTLTILTQFQ